VHEVDEAGVRVGTDGSAIKQVLSELTACVAG
jgi:transcription antitermination factor NusA-like protein